MANRKSRIRVAVVGAGKMGERHLRIYGQLKGVELVGLVEPDTNAAERLASLHNIEIFGEIEDLIGRVDAVTVATPSVTHGEIGTYLLENSIHCLIEKPLAVTEAEGLALIQAARNGGVRLMAGHVERFNPAVLQLAAILGDGHSVHAVEARRLSAVSKRIRDIDVVSDLMVHDLDIVTSLVGRPVVDLTAKAVSTNGSGGDYVTALLSFEGGAIATLTASRITQNKVRELSVTTDHGLIQIDYMAQQLAIFHQDDRTARELPGALGNYHLDVMMERALIVNAEPLALELRHFIDCIRDDTRPLISGEDALDALKLVWEIQKSYAAAV